MANAVKLVMTFTCADGKTHDFSYKYADQNAATSSVKALIAGIITNGSIFERAPVSIENAKMVVTTETEYDLS